MKTEKELRKELLEFLDTEDYAHEGDVISLQGQLKGRQEERERILKIIEELDNSDGLICNACGDNRWGFLREELKQKIKELENEN